MTPIRVRRMRILCLLKWRASYSTFTIFPKLNFYEDNTLATASSILGLNDTVHNSKLQSNFICDESIDSLQAKPSSIPSFSGNWDGMHSFEWRSSHACPRASGQLQTTETIHAEESQSDSSQDAEPEKPSLKKAMKEKRMEMKGAWLTMSLHENRLVQWVREDHSQLVGERGGGGGESFVLEDEEDFMVNEFDEAVEEDYLEEGLAGARGAYGEHVPLSAGIIGWGGKGGRKNYGTAESKA
ncbi:hypothetical protein K435DRAFT_870866 [Dendrothele bispora CBS 962.96]|uniref:Uncharacterized protein n=1 Tax=Dendrothele bispora (strain CBS 962.96) TaxID=1314807 RepID=A0A4S8L5X0_DENBC|nr:hypothetical protein K435DRAFT_870866 [Dendrothele bispora CBS 962.96]